MTGATLAADTWSAVPDYPTAASWSGRHDGAVLLHGGKKVLVAGGADASGTSVKQSAVFDLDQKTWSAPVLMNAARQLHTLTVLADGKVLATGGIAAAGAPALDTAEVYDPAAGTWTATGHALHAGRWGHSAVVLSTGLVLVAGGSTLRPGGGAVALRSAELFDPDDGTWTATGQDMTDARTGHVAVALQNGAKVLLCGGSVPAGTADDPALAFCELYDTGTGSWTPTGTMHHARKAHTATALSATTVLAAGGSAPGAPGDGSFDPFARSTAEVFDLNAGGGSWQETAPMPAGRSLHRAVSTGAGKVVVLGGTDDVTNEAGFRSAVQFESGAWTPVAGLGVGRWAFAAAAADTADTAVLVAGGVASTGLAAAGQGTELTKSAERFGSGS